MLMTNEHFLPNRFEDGNPSRPATLCGFCMVGHIAPVFRPFKDKWNLGQVEAFREDRSEFCVLFDGSDREWVHLEAAPFEAYVAHHRELLAAKEDHGSQFQYTSCPEQSWPRNANSIFRYNSRTPPIPDDPPTHALLDLTPVEEKENAQRYDIFCDDTIEAKQGPVQQPLFERNSMFDDSSEEDKPQKLGPRLWTIDVRLLSSTSFRVVHSLVLTLRPNSLTSGRPFITPSHPGMFVASEMA